MPPSLALPSPKTNLVVYTEELTHLNPEVGRVYSVTEAGTMLPDGPPPPAQPPTVFETQYSYQYDAYGNWTELTTASRSDPGAPLASGSVRRRKLTYY